MTAAEVVKHAVFAVLAVLAVIGVVAIVLKLGAPADDEPVVDEQAPPTETTDDILATLVAVRWTLEQAKNDAILEGVRHKVAVSLEAVDRVIAALEKSK